MIRNKLCSLFNDAPKTNQQFIKNSKYFSSFITLCKIVLFKTTPNKHHCYDTALINTIKQKFSFHSIYSLLKVWDRKIMHASKFGLTYILRDPYAWNFIVKWNLLISWSSFKRIFHIWGLSSWFLVRGANRGFKYCKMKCSILIES